MLNFIGYMVFSSFEYCGVILLMLSIFNNNVKYYKKEFFITVLSTTFITYFITMLNPQFVIVFIVPYLILCLKYLFKEKLVRSIIIVLGGLAIYAALQFGISQFAIHYNFITFSDLNTSFGIKPYTMQTLCSTVAITIAVYLRIFNGGFGFSLKSKKNSYKVFLYTTLSSFILSAMCLIAFTVSKNVSLFNITGVLFIVTSIVVAFLSYKRDAVEYS